LSRTKKALKTPTVQRIFSGIENCFNSPRLRGTIITVILSFHIGTSPEENSFPPPLKNLPSISLRDFYVKPKNSRIGLFIFGSNFIIPHLLNNRKLPPKNLVDNLDELLRCQNLQAVQMPANFLRLLVRFLFSRGHTDLPCRDITKTGLVSPCPIISTQNYRS